MRKTISRKALLFFGSVFFAGCTAVSSPIMTAHNPVYVGEVKRQNIRESFKRKEASNNKRTRKSIFNKNEISFQAMLGYLSSSACSIGPDIFDLKYTQLNLRLGKMINSPKKKGFLPRGNLEALIELSSSNVFKEPGNYFIGATILFRYNFVENNWKIVPYAQIGGGVVYTNVHKDSSQSAIGQSIEFTPQASLGLRYLFDKNWSFDVEAMFHHISNAGLDDRNDGVNSFGGLIGVTYNFLDSR